MKSTFFGHTLALLAVVSLLGAGCMEPAPTPSPAPITPPPSTELPPPATTTSPTGTLPMPSELPGGWNLFSHTSPSFSFGYPNEAHFSAVNPAFPQDLVFIDLGHTPTAVTTTISVPERQLHVRLVNSTSPSIQNCFYSESNWPKGYLAIHTEHLTLQGHDVCLSTEADAGAGNYYNTHNYATRIGDQYVVMSFIIHSVNCMNYEHPETQCVPLNEARDSALFEDMMSTFRFN